MKRRAVVLSMIIMLVLGAAGALAQGLAVEGYRTFACADSQGRILAWLGVPLGILAPSSSGAETKTIVDLQIVDKLPQGFGQVDPADAKNPIIRFGIYTRALDTASKAYTIVEVISFNEPVLLWIPQKAGAEPKGGAIKIRARDNISFSINDKDTKGKKGFEYSALTWTQGGQNYTMLSFSAWPAGDPFAIVPPFD